MAAIAILTLLLVGIQFVESAKAVVEMKPLYETCTIQSPQSITYYSNTILVKFLIETNFASISLCYTLDGIGAMLEVNQSIISETAVNELPYYFPYTDHIFKGTAVLSFLSDGKHFITIYRRFNHYFYLDPDKYVPIKTVKFTVDTSAPTLRMLLLQNSCFDLADVTFNFTVSEPVSELSYSLDGNSKVMFTDSVVLFNGFGIDRYFFAINSLGEGNHSLKIYAKDLGGFVGESEIYYFTVNSQLRPTSSASPSPFPSPSPSTTIAPTLEPTQTSTSLTPYLSPTEQLTLEPTQTSSPINGDNQAIDSTLILALSCVVVVAISIVVLAYFKKKRGVP